MDESPLKMVQPIADPLRGFLRPRTRPAPPAVATTRPIEGSGGSEGETLSNTAPGELKFCTGDLFYRDLRRRVERYFRDTGRRERDCPRMYLKTALVLGWFAASYVALVFLAGTWLLALPLAISLGLSMAAIGFNIQHDGGHQAYSNRPWVNKLMAMTLDLSGRQFVRLGQEAQHGPSHVCQHHGPRRRHQHRLPRSAVAAPKAAEVSPVPAFLLVDAVRRSADQVAALRRLPGRAHRPDWRAPLRAAQGVGPGDLRRRQSGLLLAGIRDPAAAASVVGRACCTTWRHRSYRA